MEKFVGTERADRTDVKDRSERSQMNPVPMEMDANIQGLINISYKRMCTAADPTTRQYWMEVWKAVREIDPNVAHVMVPQCVRVGGCPEWTNCGFFEKFAEGLTKEELLDVHTRYEKYNEYRDEMILKRVKK